MFVNKQRKIKNKFIFNNQRGMALITTLIFVFVLVSFSVALLVMTGNDSKLSTLHRESTRAFYLAETGVDKALWYLNTPTDQDGYGINWRTDKTDPPGPLTDGTATLNAGTLTGLIAPTAGSDAANKAYVDSVSQGLSFKDPVNSATTANIVLGSLGDGSQLATLTGAGMDGITYLQGTDEGLRLLVKDQTNQVQNGIYVLTLCTNTSFSF